MILGIQKVISHLKNAKIIGIMKNIWIKTKISLSKILVLIILTSFRLIPLKKQILLKKLLRLSSNKNSSIKVIKKDKIKANSIRYIKCYICKQKSYYTNKYLKKLKNKCQFW